MVYPKQLEENEYIRMLAMKKGEDKRQKVEFIRTFDEFVKFIANHRYSWDVYCQLATNQGKESGSKESQYRRKVLFLDFDQKDYPEFKDAEDVTKFVKDKLPKLFILNCISSGHGFHLYISINNETASFEEIIQVNKQLISLLGADAGAGSVAQVARPPYTFNHKYNGGYDYNDKNVWEPVISVFNDIDKPGYHALGVSFIIQQMKDHTEKEKNRQILEEIGHANSSLEDNQCYYCIQKALELGADKTERNTWHGRIVKYFQLIGKGPSEIHSLCQQWNKKCRPPKPATVIAADTEKFINEEYNLLGCYESIPDKRKSKIVEKNCDKTLCITHQKGVSKKVNSPEVPIPISILKNQNLRDMSGYAFLLVAMLHIHKNQKMTVKKLKALLNISRTANDCMSPKVFNETLEVMIKNGWIELIPHRVKAPFGNCEIKLLKKAKSTPKGNILLYHSVVQAMISGEISQTEFRIYLTMKRNLSRGRDVTFEQLASDLNMCETNIGKYINYLIRDNCLLKEAEYNGNRRFLRYIFPCPDAIKRVNKEKSHLFVRIENGNNGFFETFSSYSVVKFDGEYDYMPTVIRNVTVSEVAGGNPYMISVIIDYKNVNGKPEDLLMC